LLPHDCAHEILKIFLSFPIMTGFSLNSLILGSELSKDHESAYYELDAHGALKHLSKGTPTPHHIIHQPHCFNADSPPEPWHGIDKWPSDDYDDELRLGLPGSLE
jgi:hypothetical protein